MVYQAEYPPQGNCKSVILCNNVHEEGVCSHKVVTHLRFFGSLRGHTLEKLEAVWRSWSEQDWPFRQAVSSADVKANIVVKPAAEIHETSLMLMEWDRGAQRS